MDNGRLKEKKKPHRHFDYWPPNRGGRLIGGRLIEVGLYNNERDFHRMRPPHSPLVTI